MQADYLREFTELVNHMSFTEAANALHMTQPTLSKHIRALETSLGLELVDRSGPRVALTECGSALASYAYRAVEAQNEFNSVAAKLREAPPPRLRVRGLTDESPSTEVLGFLVSLLGEKYGTGFLEVKSSCEGSPEELLEQGLADIVFDSGTSEFPAPESPGGCNSPVKAVLLGKVPLIALVDRRHTFAGHGWLPIKAFRDSTVLKFEGVYLQRSWCHVEAAFARHGFTPKFRSFYCGNVAELLASCANLGSTVLFVGKNFAERIPQGIRPYCSMIEIEEQDAAIPLHFLYREDNPNPLLREVVEYLQSAATSPFEFSRGSAFQPEDGAAQ